MKQHLSRWTVLLALLATACDADEGGGDNERHAETATLAGQLPLSNCTFGQYASWDGTDWVCAGPMTDTKLSESEVDAFADNNGYLLSEVDPTVGNLVADRWCRANGAGTGLDCTQPSPVVSELDPTVNGLGNADLTACTEGQIPKLTAGIWSCTIDQTWPAIWQGSPDISYSGGNVGIGTPTPTEALEINGNLKVSGTITAGEMTWTAPILENGYVNFGGVWAAAGYYKDHAQRVHLKGLVKNGSVSLCIFTLPVGYQPAEDRVFAVDAVNVHARLDIRSDGCVLQSNGSNVYVSLNGVSFTTF